MQYYGYSNAVYQPQIPPPPLCSPHCIACQQNLAPAEVLPHDFVYDHQPMTSPSYYYGQAQVGGNPMFDVYSDQGSAYGVLSPIPSALPSESHGAAGQYEMPDRSLESSHHQLAWQSDSGISSPFIAADAQPDEDQEVEDIGPGIAGIREAEADAPKPVDEYLSRNMHVKWHMTFSELFNKNCHMGTEWLLIPTFDPPAVNRHKLFQYHDTAKVRFSCYDCGKSWTSVKGNVVFWIFKDDVHNKGFIQFKLYGQKCVECKPKLFEHAIWYEEEVERVLRNLYNKVIALYYGVAQAPRETNVRWARPRQPHDPDSCSACHDGICSHQRRQFHSSRGGRHQQQQKLHHQVIKQLEKCSIQNAHEVVESAAVGTEDGGNSGRSVASTSKVLYPPTRGIIRQRSMVTQ